MGLLSQRVKVLVIVLDIAKLPFGSYSFGIPSVQGKAVYISTSLSERRCLLLTMGSSPIWWRRKYLSIVYICISEWMRSDQHLLTFKRHLSSFSFSLGTLFLYFAHFPTVLLFYFILISSSSLQSELSGTRIKPLSVIWNANIFPSLLFVLHYGFFLLEEVLDFYIAKFITLFNGIWILSHSKKDIPKSKAIKKFTKVLI